MESQDLEIWQQSQSQMEPTQAPPSETDSDTLYEASLQRFQDGNWQEAIAGLEKVLQLRPDHTEARALLEQAQLKASVERDRPKPQRRQLRRLTRSLVLIVGGVIILLVLVTGLRWAYGRWVRPLRSSQREVTLVTEQLSRAQQYLAEQDYEAAEEAFLALLADDPTNEEALAGLAQVREGATLAEDYAEAQQAIIQQDWEEALRLLAALGEKNAQYKDVEQLRLTVQKELELGTWFEKAEAAYLAGNWLEASAAYESLRNLDIKYQESLVTDHLYESYLKQGINLVESSGGNAEVVRDAQELYQDALALKPQDPIATQELAIAQRYLEARALLAQADLEAAIGALEWVEEQRPGYAEGTAAALLKTATEAEDAAAIESTVPAIEPPSSEANLQEQYIDFLQKGDAALAAGDYALARQYYSQATAIAMPWLLTAYVRLAATQVQLENYELAVATLQTAFQILSDGAVAIPPSAYAEYVEQGDRYAENQAYRSALAEYDQALQIIEQKCACGLENWSVLP